MTNYAASSHNAATLGEPWPESSWRGARRELRELSWPLIDAIEHALGVLEREPEAGYELRGRLRGLRSLRVGSYRIIYQLIEAGRTVRVAAIRHRAAAYRGDPR